MNQANNQPTLQSNNFHNENENDAVNEERSEQIK